MNPQDNHNEPMEVNSDSDSSDEEAEQALLAKAEALEKQISDNKYLYNAHEELVSLYRQLGDLTSMRLAYERFAEHFPLTPEIWLAWIEVEKELATTEVEIKGIFALFDKAVEDYMSVSLWIEYTQYSIGASSLETTRQIVERGVTSVGLNTLDGSLLWDTYRELELAHLSLAPPDTDQFKQQLSKVVDIFKRQLSVPLLNMESTYKEWQQFLEQFTEHKIDTQPIEWGYNKALKTLATLKPFEEKLQLASEETERLQIYREYIKAIQDPSTVLCVFERAVAQLCLNPCIWLEFCQYVFKLGELADKVSKRALRNCPWSEELWIVRLRVLEKLQRDEQEIMQCFEQAVAQVGSTQELWLTYLEFVSRKSDRDKLYKTFEQALEQLKYQEGETKVTKWYARILSKNGDLPTARKLWKNILRIPQNKASANVWLEFIQLEKQYGDVQQQRNLFQRALTSCTDWPQCVAEEWLMFEREHGTLEDVIKCAEKRNELKLVQQPIEESSPKKRKVEEAAEPVMKKTRTEQEPYNTSNRKKPIVKDPTVTVFVSNLHTTVNEKRLKKFFPSAINVEIVTDRKGRSRCYGYAQFSIEEEVMHALARDRELLDGRPVFISQCKPDRVERKAGFKYSLESEDSKLFVKGLPFDKTEEDIRNIFEGFDVKDVRLVRKRDGKSKGLAYVEFQDAETARKAMSKTDQMQMGQGNVITVAISAPPPKQATSKNVAPVRHARSKLQIPLLPRAVQQASNGEENTAQKPKTNQDFRNMLLNK